MSNSTLSTSNLKRKYGAAYARVVDFSQLSEVDRVNYLQEAMMSENESEMSDCIQSVRNYLEDLYDIEWNSQTETHHYKRG